MRVLASNENVLGLFLITNELTQKFSIQAHPIRSLCASETTLSHRILISLVTSAIRSSRVVFNQRGGLEFEPHQTQIRRGTRVKHALAAVHADASLTQVGERQMSSAAERGGRLCLFVARPALSLALQALSGTPQSEVTPRRRASGGHFGSLALFSSLVTKGTSTEAVTQPVHVSLRMCTGEENAIDTAEGKR
ncbi:hypothetical protein EVAR_98004_1 [Eumeta japonica]|uniref:Uncharacterized protein n=1 Tax=Eumeta variegata TaxID=151549 RepID=A0A4C1WK07_EUMVA|nr:hypothetical protein EVAR_98004_1 [Eumeta japonica]